MGLVHYLRFLNGINFRGDLISQFEKINILRIYRFQIFREFASIRNWFILIQGLSQLVIEIRLYFSIRKQASFVSKERSYNNENIFRFDFAILFQYFSTKGFILFDIAVKFYYLMFFLSGKIAKQTFLSFVK